MKYSIAKARTGYYYAGITTKPELRILKHNQGKGSHPFPNKSEARKREIQIKGWTREKKQKLINGEWK